MLKKKIASETTLGEIFSGMRKADPSMSEKVTTIEIINNLGVSGKEIYLPCQENMESISVSKGAIVALKLNNPPVGGIGFF